MIIKRSMDLYKNGIRVGDTIWACAFEYTYSKEGLRLVQRPEFGMLTAGNTEELNRQLIEKGYTSPAYFVPFKKDGSSLAYYKAVRAVSRSYASTEEECREMFNELIGSCINWHNISIDELNSMRLE